MKANPMIKPGSKITQTFSEEHVKIIELREYCKVADTKLKELKEEMQSLKVKKHESQKLKNENEMRNTININNYESLLRAKNELYKYKCDLKSEYVGIEKTSKVLKGKYKNIITSYEAEWQKTLDHYNSSSIVVELFHIQQGNAHLEKEIEALLKLKNHTETEFVKLERDTKQKFFEKVVGFAEQMMRYKNFIRCNALENEKTEAGAKDKKNTERADNSSSSKKNSIFALPKGPLENHNKGDLAFFSSIDMSEFDDLCVPKETLESQNEEEMFSIICDTIKRNETNSKESRTAAEEYPVQRKIPKYEHGYISDDKKEKCASAKASVNNDNKSQYFTSTKQKQQEGQTPGELQSNLWSGEQGFFKSGKTDYDKNKEDINFNIKCKGSTTDGGDEGFLTEAGEVKFREQINDSGHIGNFDSKNISIEERQTNVSYNEENFEIRYRPASSASSEEVSIGMTADNKDNSPGPGKVDQNHFKLKMNLKKWV